MTVLSACQSASVRLIGRRPTSIFSSTGTMEIELADLATETAVAIAKVYDWQALRTLTTLTGDGSTVAFDLPSDYARMLKKGGVHSSLYTTDLFRRVDDEDEWIFIQDEISAGTPGSWIILGGQMQIWPAMASGETARFYYIKNTISGTKTAFTADTDTFTLPERLLTLGLIWRWRQQKRKEYAEDMRNYEIALSEEIANDRGSNVLTVGRVRMSGNVSVAYPRALGS